MRTGGQSRPKSTTKRPCASAFTVRRHEENRRRTAMKAITIWPEWSLAFILLGKNLENRTWPAPRDLIGETVAIHAGSRIGGKIDPGETGIGKTEHQRRTALAAYEDVFYMSERAGFTRAEVSKIVSGSTWYQQREYRGMRFGNNRSNTGHMRTWWFADCPKGAIFATATLAWSSKCSEDGTHYQNGEPASPWSAPGQYGFKTEDIKVFDTPVPCRGAQGFWIVPDDVRRQLVFGGQSE